jgi:hypothetical protein
VIRGERGRPKHPLFSAGSLPCVATRNAGACQAVASGRHVVRNRSFPTASVLPIAICQARIYVFASVEPGMSSCTQESDGVETNGPRTVSVAIKNINKDRTVFIDVYCD